MKQKRFLLFLRKTPVLPVMQLVLLLAILIISPVCLAEKLRPAPAEIRFISVDFRAVKGAADWPAYTAPSWSGTGWKGEAIHTQLMLRSDQTLSALELQFSALTSPAGNLIIRKNIEPAFVYYVWANGLSKSGGGCGINNTVDSLQVADRIGNQKLAKLDSGNFQPVWLTINIPENAAVGLYGGKLKLYAGSRYLCQVNYQIKVQPHQLPAPESWHNHPDLWQNPYSISRWYHVQPWSASHLEHMRPYMQLLAKAGQKTITATLIDDPWNGQTFDRYQSMVKWIHKENGTWGYDYTIFDRWVSFMMSCGIRQQINCYGMLPWNLKFRYFSQAAGRDTELIAQPSSQAYQVYWERMLKDFSRHIRKKGWQGKVYIAMDERPLAEMQEAIAVIRQAAPGLKIALAGVYHPELDTSIQDYSIASGDSISPARLASRVKQGFITTFYTCCTEGKPNTFTFSPPAESAWLPLYACHKGFDGYLRWAYNCWNAHPLKDSRFGTWSSGDAFLVYPNENSSIRFERLIEGMQYAEKVRLLTSRLTRDGNSRQLNKLKAAMLPFELGGLQQIPAAQMVNNLERTVDQLN